MKSGIIALILLISVLLVFLTGCISFRPATPDDEAHKIVIKTTETTDPGRSEPTAPAKPTTPAEPTRQAEPTTPAEPTKSAETTETSGAPKTYEPDPTPHYDPFTDTETSEPFPYPPQHTTEPTPTHQAEPTTEPTPTRQAEPTTEPTPTHQAEPTTEPTPTHQAEPTTEPTPTHQAEPTTEPTPTVPADPTTQPTPTVPAEPTEPTPQSFVVVPESSRADASYFKNGTLFIGDSLTTGMPLYNVIDSNFYCVESISTGNIMTEAFIERDGGKITLASALQADGDKWERIYIQLGVNEMWSDAFSFRSRYGKMIDQIQTYCPNAKIYVQSVFPITQSASLGNYKDFGGNTKLSAFNDELLELCVSRGLYYVNVYEILDNGRGALKDELAGGDGVHIPKSTYQLWVDYLFTHTAD